MNTSPLLPAAILAGGLATRLRPMTVTIPKSLIDIGGEPFIAHQLRLLAGSGIREVVLCLGHLGEMVRDYVEDGSRFGIAVKYSFDGPLLRGTAGAIANALPSLGQRFFVLYGDSYLPCSYSAIQETFIESGRLGLRTVYENENRFDASNVVYQNGRIIAYNKKTRLESCAT